MYTKQKFLRLDLPQQHKKCAEILRTIYTHLLEDQKPGTEKTIYHNFSLWLKLPSLDIQNLKQLADRYHWHLFKANLSLKEHNFLPSIRTGDRISDTPFLPIAIYLDQMRSAYNVGSILRTTEAFRLGRVYFSSSTPFQDHPKVYKASMGSSDIVPCFQEFTLEDLPRPWIVLETSDEAPMYHSYPFPESFTLILGNEEYGVSDAMIEKADQILQIPMFGAKNSLNVACAFSIVASEIRRQVAS